MFGRLIGSDHVLALADQSLVSAMGFIALIVLGRCTDLGEVGIYAASVAVLALALAIQDALVARPYAIEFHRPNGSTFEHAFSTLLLSVGLSAMLALLIAATALLAGALGAQGSWTTIAWLLAGATPFVLLREFARRHAFAHLRVRQVLKLDMAVVVVNLALLAGLVSTGMLSARTAILSQALSCAVGFAGWLFALRDEFQASTRFVWRTAKRSWITGRWLLSSQVAVQVQGYTSHWLSLAILGPVSTGLYAACSSTVAMANPVVFGLINLIIPKSARSFAGNGGAGVRMQAGQDAVVLGLVMGVFCLLLALFGQELTGGLFGAEGDRALIVLLGLASLMGAVGVPASIALTSAGRARAVGVVSAAVAVANLGLALWLIPHFGLLGAASAAVAAEAAGALGRWLALITLVGGRDEAGEEQR